MVTTTTTSTITPEVSCYTHLHNCLDEICYLCEYVRGLRERITDTSRRLTGGTGLTQLDGEDVQFISYEVKDVMEIARKCNEQAECFINHYTFVDGVYNAKEALEVQHAESQLSYVMSTLEDLQDQVNHSRDEVLLALVSQGRGNDVDAGENVRCVKIARRR